MKKIFKKFNIWYFLAAIVMVLALMLSSNNISKDKKAETRSKDILKKLDYIIEDRPISQSSGFSPQRQMPSIKIGKYSYIGELIIEKEALRLPVMEKWDYERLEIAPCRYSGSIYTKDMVIIAHNYKSHFAVLNDLNQGDKLEFIDVEGKKYKYKLSQAQIFSPDQVNTIIDRSDQNWDLTLFTCNFLGDKRLTLRFNLLDENNI